MKNSLFSFFFCLTIALYGQTNRALLVAIDEYPPESGWKKIHATNDVQLLYPLLIEKGFSSRDIFLLKNEKATKSAIVKALNSIYHQAKKGDYIYVHFSCHGQQMLDDNGDEPDGLDEAMIPYDAKRRYYKGSYEGENHLRDDEFGVLLDDIRKKIGKTGNITVLLDACHSGTGTRYNEDDEYVRGTSYIFAPDDYDQSERPKGEIILEHTRAPHLSPITVLSACKEDELNYEYRTEDNVYYGALTYAFYTLLNRKGSDKLSVTEFSKELENIIKDMFSSKRWKQTPYFETTVPTNKFAIGK